RVDLPAHALLRAVERLRHLHLQVQLPLDVIGIEAILQYAAAGRHRIAGHVRGNRGGDLFDSRSGRGLPLAVGDREVGRVDAAGGGAGLAVAVLAEADSLVRGHAAGAAIGRALCGPAFTLLAGAIPADATADPECAAAVVGVVL